MRRSSQRSRSGAKLFFFLRVAFRHGFGDSASDKFFVIQRRGIRARSFGVDAELAMNLRQELRGVPLAGMLLRGQ